MHKNQQKVNRGERNELHTKKVILMMPIKVCLLLSFDTFCLPFLFRQQDSSLLVLHVSMMNILPSKLFVSHGKQILNPYHMNIV